MKYDVVIVGAGIIGLSTAYQLSKKLKNKNILVLEKEDTLAQHQTGHNSGVIHSGIYYKPGSYKANFAKQGAKSMYEFCDTHNVKHHRCGKVIVATDKKELSRLHDLYKRGLQNELDVELLDKDQVNEIEPYVNTVGGILVRNTGIVDYKDVSQKFSELFQENGGEIRLNSKVDNIFVNQNEVLVVSNKKIIQTSYIINCAGLYSDKIAKLCDVETDVKIIPFRGEYYQFEKNVEHYVNTLIYPVPNPELPFLGVHFTNMIKGGVDVGPNAVLGLKKESYSKIGIDKKETFEILSFPGLYKMGLNNIKEGIGEYYRSFNKQAFVKNAQKLIPYLKDEDVYPIEAGVRAQAMDILGNLLDDFHFEENNRTFHVLNAPSPAATCSIEIGVEIANNFKNRLIR